jgi:RNA polymerase sigma-70 factor (ECF subfamily)
MNPYHDHNDAELVTLLKEGNARAFEAIYRRYIAELYQFARRNIQVKEDAEEMVQDVFESLWVRHKKIKVDSLRHYLKTSIRYMVIRYFYNKGVRKKYLEHYKLFAVLYESADEQERSPEDIQTMLIKGLEGLPERCQAAIRFRITENLSNGEIAKRMNITKKTVEMYISKALHHLRSSFREVYKTG